MGQQGSRYCMPTFMIGDQLQLFLGQRQILALQSHEDLVACFFDIFLLDRRLVLARGQQRCLIQHIFQICPAETGRAASHLLQLHVVRQGLVTGMNLENRQPVKHRRLLDRDLPVKAPGAQQRRIENIRAIGGGHHDHVFARLKTVQLREQLV